MCVLDRETGEEGAAAAAAATTEPCSRSRSRHHHHLISLQALIFTDATLLILEDLTHITNPSIDLSQTQIHYYIDLRRTKTSLPKWAAEITATGTFSAPLANGGPGGLPVPYIVIGNKADIASKEGRRNSSGNLVDMARQWVEKQGLLPPSEELPLSDSFPGSGGLLAAAKEARYDKESVMKFFRMLVRRRYFSDELPTENPWSTTMQQPLQRSDDILSDEDHLYTRTRYS